ncbi:amino acid adenylation domain-containing protein [Micromonospora sp. DT231]|uniref:amino acid adenylation domain-containing protein n=1 Tax=Micromonospora sp. DT231 TaxID=3416526 RepID=UPI003CFA1650
MTALTPGLRACLHDLFAERAAAHPDAVAVTHAGRHLTYRELDRRANALAHRLRVEGVGPGVLVAVRVRRTPDAVVALLGVVKAGGAYVPLDPAHPADRHAFVCADSGARLLVTDQPAEHPSGLPVLDIAAVGPGVDTAPEATGAEADDLAYLIYTSGSTGRPKGVQVEHANVVALLGSTSARFGFTRDDVWTLFASLAFDVSVWEMWGALLHGARLVIVDEDDRRSPAALHDLLRRENVTVLNLTPAAFRQLSRHEEDTDAATLPALRRVIFAGESLTPAMLRPWLHRHGDEQPLLVNMYGITETTVHSTWRRMTTADLAEPDASLIGLPLAGWTAVVLDEAGQPAPTGTPGELHVGGAGVARGYAGRPDLTRARFVTGPPEWGGRLYRSGDSCLVRPDGELQYLGRLDHQVKLRGHRIELGEIDAALGDHPAVHEAVTVLDERAEQDARLVAYVVLGAAAAPDELRAHLARSLPDYMLPAVFVTMDRLPLTGNGKVDRAALPEPGTERPALSAPLVQPRTPVQQQLAEIWAEVLGVAEVGLDDDFFDLGGHSMLATRAVALARERYGLAVSLRALFDAPTVGLLAGLLDEDPVPDLSPSAPVESRT